MDSLDAERRQRQTLEREVASLNAQLAERQEQSKARLDGLEAEYKAKVDGLEEEYEAKLKDLRARLKAGDEERQLQLAMRADEATLAEAKKAAARGKASGGRVEWNLSQVVFVLGRGGCSFEEYARNIFANSDAVGVVAGGEFVVPGHQYRMQDGSDT